MSVADTATDLRTRAAEATDVGRARAAQVRARTEDLSGAVRERAEQVAGTAEPHVRDVVARASVAASALPGVTERVLDGLARAFGFLGEGARAVAARVERPTHDRRRERMRTAAWFVGGLAVGAAGGWVAHARLHQQPQEPYRPSPTQELPLRRTAATDHANGVPHGQGAEAIDARRQNAGLS